MGRNGQHIDLEVLGPLTRSFVSKRAGHPEAVEEVNKLRRNDLHEIKEDIKTLQKEMGGIKERLAVIETRQKNHMK